MHGGFCVWVYLWYLLKVLITWNQAGLRVVTATTEHALRSAGIGYRSRANSLSFQYALFTKFSSLLAILFTFLSVEIITDLFDAQGV